MQELRVLTRITNISNVDKFKMLFRKAFIIAAQESGTLQYECYLDVEGKSCTHLETFKNSDAVAVHVQNIASIFQEIVQICDLEFIVLGDRDEKITVLAEQFGAKIIPFFGGTRLS